MGKYRRMRDVTNSTDPGYIMAFKRVKRIKGFYVHLMIYLIFNVIIILADKADEPTAHFWSWETFSLPVFWGIGLLAHAASVFGRDLIFGKKWEERKIREFMERQPDQNWK